MDICTIIAKNYVAQARVLARSFLEHHPDGRVATLVIDDFADYLDPSVEDFAVLTPHDIGCEPFDDMAARYSVLELSTAVKPWLLRHLLDNGASPITYLDPDIRIYAPLTRIDDLAREHGIVVTPHNTRGIPFDGHRPSQIDILIAGVYNLGFVSFGPGQDTDNVLEWWADRLRRDCRVDPIYGYFVDQRWFDLVPGLVTDYCIMRDPEYNLAYWNAHERELSLKDGVYQVDGRELRFFHFSGFDPETPETLSRHQTRIRLDERPLLSQLCADYATEVQAAGYSEAKGWQYSLDRLPDGTRFTKLLRELYAEGAKTGDIVDAPFTDAGASAFLGWLSESPAGPLGINRALLAIYNSRPDVQAAFRDLASATDRAAFTKWVNQQADPDLELPAVLCSSPEVDANESGAVHVVTASVPWGVNVVGYFRSELGTGEAARQVVNALDAVEVPLLPIHGETIPPNRQGHEFAHLTPAAARFPVNLICMNADALPEFAAQVAPEGFFENRYSIGLWFWEVSTFPDRWKGSFDLVDEVWAPTRHIADTLSRVAPIPVVHMPLAVELPAVTPRPRAALGLPSGFIFLFMFDYHSVFERKNPLAVIEAFSRAFADVTGAALVIKFMNEASDPLNHDCLVKAADRNPNIHLIGGPMSPSDKDALIAASDCYVSLHRSEGFGLTMAEAMYLGKPVIATGYSGNADFMTAANSFLVDYRMVRIGGGADPYPPEGEWADPDVDEAARTMRAVFDDQAAANEIGERAAVAIRSTQSPRAVGTRMAQRLDAIRAMGHGTRTAATHDPLIELLQRVAHGPMPAAHKRKLSPRLLARRAVLRAIKPFTAYQTSINETVLRALEGQRRETEELGRALPGGTVVGLRGLRRQERAIAAFQSAVVDRIDRIQGGVDTLAALRAPIVARLDAVDGLAHTLEADAHARPYMDGVPFSPLGHAVAGLVEGYVDDTGETGALYRSFEDTFRGAERFIRNRQRIYIDLLDGREPVLEFGCGRGEFLDLLREAALDYRGVDLDEGMVERCHAKGHHDVVAGDGLVHLEQQQQGSLGAIFASQVIEHLPYEQLLRLLGLARGKLRDDGLLIMETVNPHSARALKAFWVDPTHQHPLFPEVVLTLCRASGFGSAFMFHPNGTGDVNQDRFVQGEYAVVAAIGGAGLGLRSARAEPAG